MAVESIQKDLTTMKTRQHGHCVVCSRTNEKGLGLEFELQEDGSVEAQFGCDRDFEGYKNILHGGVVSSMLDGAMTSCMFAHGLPAVTAELKVRFRNPVITEHPAVVRARIVRSSAPLYVLEAEVAQDGLLKATAEGKFMEKTS